jgi:hypothetical protein
MPSRYACSVLTEIRTALKVGRIDMVIGLVEELQTLVNRMECGLQDYNEMGYNLDLHRKLKKEISQMEDITGTDEFSDEEEFISPKSPRSSFDEGEVSFPGSEDVPDHDSGVVVHPAGVTVRTFAKGEEVVEPPLTLYDGSDKPCPATSDGSHNYRWFSPTGNGKRMKRCSNCNRIRCATL